MPIVESEIARVQIFSPGQLPNYNDKNPIWKLIRVCEATVLAADREHYLPETLQHLFGVHELALVGPAGVDWQLKDPRQQDNKNDFQKQNIYDFELNGTEISRGYANAGSWEGSFLRIAYLPRGPLLGVDGVFPGVLVQLELRVGAGGTGTDYLQVPYNSESGRYEIELWAYPGVDLREQLGPRGQKAMARGALLARPDLVQGHYEDFSGKVFDAARDAARAAGQGLDIYDRFPNHTMHPVRPLRLELAWTDTTATRWDRPAPSSRYIYEFSMSLRGWNNYFSTGDSRNPHGGVGGLEYRNLFSNYFGHEAQRQREMGSGWQSELGRVFSSWNCDADNAKPSSKQREDFFAVDYMDLHILKPAAVIGLHRHRDNQEVFLLMEGRGLMAMGDWETIGDRQRAVELRTMHQGDLTLVKKGQFHALINLLDENLLLFMFGGYD